MLQHKAALSDNVGAQPH